MALKVPLCRLNLAAAIALLAMCACSVSSRTTHDWLMADKHENWMSTFGRTYEDEVEKGTRFKIFQQNVAYIESFNQEGTNKTYRLAPNKFSDLTNEEFLERHTGYINELGSMASTTSFMYEDAATDVPDSVDWRDRGAVTDVKDQGTCGCCWAFSAVAAMEGANKLKTNILTSLSEQELLDCDTPPNLGCEGGSMTNAFDYIEKYQGLSHESDYPYVESDGTCKPEAGLSRFGAITGYERVPANSESALMMAVANQPVSVAIDAGGYAFQNYAGGVFNGGGCGSNLNHALTAVGYGEESDGTKFWVCKNSWGSGWGENGYVRIEKDVDAAEGLCGIAMDASYPIVA